MRKIDEILKLAVESRASDIHFSSDQCIWARIDGDLNPFGEIVFSSEDLKTMLMEVCSATERERLETHKNLDKSYFIEGIGNFRVNIFYSRKGIGAVIRTLPSKIPTIDELGLPPVIKALAELPKGLILVTGPTGSGKSTTLSAIINHMNQNFPYHILTAEDPVEFIHPSKKSLVNQREIGHSCPTFADALKYALREDPDVILVGEMRDLETISLAMTAAETGHLVLGTLHTRGAASTIDRVIESFPAMQQPMVRAMLAESLQAVISQTLVKKASGKGRVAAYEIMVMNFAISNLVREGKTYQIPSAIQTGRKEGMLLMESHLRELAQAGEITEEDAEAVISSISRGGHAQKQAAGGGANSGGGQPPAMGAPSAPPPPMKAATPMPVPAASPMPVPSAAPTPAVTPAPANKASVSTHINPADIDDSEMLQLDELGTGQSDISSVDLDSLLPKEPPQLQTPGAKMSFKPLEQGPAKPAAPAAPVPVVPTKPVAAVPKPTPAVVPKPVAAPKAATPPAAPKATPPKPAAPVRPVPTPAAKAPAPAAPKPAAPKGAPTLQPMGLPTKKAS